jgi:hypothetical protein
MIALNTGLTWVLLRSDHAWHRTTHSHSVFRSNWRATHAFCGAQVAARDDCQDQQLSVIAFTTMAPPVLPTARLCLTCSIPGVPPIVMLRPLQGLVV